MTDIPLIAGRGHAGFAPQVEVQGGRRLPAFDRVGRIDVILDELDRRGGYSRYEPEHYGLEPVLAVHERGMVEFLEEADRRAGEGADGMLFADTFLHRRLREYLAGEPDLGFQGRFGRYCYDTICGISPGTYAAAIEAAGCALTAADSVIGGGALAVALTRPPGHHASARLFGGGTYLNNAAVTAEFLCSQGRARVALLDVDIHHGNGSQAIFYERGDVMFASVHAEPTENYPFFVGFADERGAAAGEGANVNVPLPSNPGIDEYLRSLALALEKLDGFDADALVVSLGLDGHEDDPVQAASLATADFGRVGAAVGELGLPTVAVLEGGYALDSLGASIAEWLEGFASMHRMSHARGARS